MCQRTQTIIQTGGNKLLKQDNKTISQFRLKFHQPIKLLVVLNSYQKMMINTVYCGFFCLRAVSWKCVVCFRDLRSEVGGDGAVWAPVWEQAGAHAGGAVCGLHPAVGPSGGGSVQAARTGQPGQGAAGRVRLRRKTLVWLVRDQIGCSYFLSVF